MDNRAASSQARTQQAKPPKPDPTWRVRLRLAYENICRLQGNPHYVAMGMAIGVFVAVTPTFPFHTLLAIALAFILRGSKPAAIIGVWFSNPVTIPIFYFGSFKIGTLLMRIELPDAIPYQSIGDLLNLGAEVTLAMMLGGCVLGILPAVSAYFLTFRIVRQFRREGVCEPGAPTIER
ncbi:MAG: DUF2062 domain-containing protein [Desulfosarcinaceae bacterium]